MAKQPALQFYIGDWMKDPNLRRCSAAARGVWIDTLCLMHEMPTRGVLRDDTGAVWTIEDIANAISGASVELVTELITKGVMKCSRRTGTYFSARMVRDLVTSKRRARSGSAGGFGRMKQKPSKMPAKPQAKPKQTPEDEDEEVIKRGGCKGGTAAMAARNYPLAANIDTPGVRAAWVSWVDSRVLRGKTPTEVSLSLTAKKCSQAGAEEAERALGLAAASDWSGVFVEKNNGKGRNNRQLSGVSADEGKYAGVGERLGDEGNSGSD